MTSQIGGLKNENIEEVLPTTSPTSPSPLLSTGIHKDVCLKWIHAATTVEVTGTFNDWGTPIPLKKTTDAFRRGQFFAAILKLVPGPHNFKFIVDGDWKYDPTIAFEADSFGNINNVMVVDGSSDIHLQEPVKVMRWTSMSGEEARRKWRIASTIYRQEVEQKALEEQRKGKRSISLDDTDNEEGNSITSFTKSSTNEAPTLDSPIMKNFLESSTSNDVSVISLQRAEYSMSQSQIDKLKSGIFDDKSISEDSIDDSQTLLQSTRTTTAKSHVSPQHQDSCDDDNKDISSQPSLPLYVKELSSTKLPPEESTIEQGDIHDEHGTSYLNRMRHHELHQSTIEYGLEPGSTSLLNISLSRKGSTTNTPIVMKGEGELSENLSLNSQLGKKLKALNNNDHHYHHSTHHGTSLTRSRSFNELDKYKNEQQQVFNQLGYHQFYNDPTEKHPFGSLPHFTIQSNSENSDKDNTNRIDIDGSPSSVTTNTTLVTKKPPLPSTKSDPSSLQLKKDNSRRKITSDNENFVQDPRFHSYYDPAILKPPLCQVSSVTSFGSENEKHHLDAAVGSMITNSSVKRDGKLLICMCGLPGTGKTLMAKMIRRHLEWMGMKVGYYGVSEYRRKVVGDRMPPSYFDPTNHQGYSSRMNVANMAIDDAIEEMNDQNIDIAVFDGSNMTKARRLWIINRVEHRNLYAKVIFIESICVDNELLQNNIHQTTLRSPDFKGMTRDEAIIEFEQRYRHYMSIYESIAEEEDISFMKIFDGGKKLVSYKVNGYIPGRIMLLLANIHTKPRPIWFSRHGESIYNTQGKIGGDSKLSKNGMAYAKKLTEFFDTVYKAR